MREPFASIVIPTYNHENFIAAALDSVIAQTDPDWEAIVVNDGSTDSTPSIIAAYAARNSRIRTVHKSNGGVATALNAGIEQARGSWIHWLSSDDMFTPEKLAINRRAIEQNPGTSFFFSYFWLLRELTGSMEQHDLWGPLPEPEYQMLGLLYRNYISGISVCVNRLAWQQVGFFDQRNHYAQDVDLWFRILSRYRGVFIPEWTVINRTHPGQGSEVFPDAMYFDAAKACISFLNGSDFPGMLPQVDLDDPAAAAAAVEKALDIACEPTGMLYFLGPHPALILRILEWVFADGAVDGCRRQLRARVIERIRKIALADEDNDWHWMWRGLAAACGAAEPRFVYHKVDSRALALREYSARQQGRGGNPEPLRRYLRRFENIELREEPTPGSGSARIVLMARDAELAAATASSLTGLGHRPVMFLSAAARYRWHDAVPVIPRAAKDHDQLPWLGVVELAVSLNCEPVSEWVEALATLSVADDLVEPQALLAKIIEALGLSGASCRRRTVALLELTAWGGGAETAAVQILRHLDRGRFAPVILTLWNAHSQKHAVPDIPVFWVDPFVGDAPDTPPPPRLNNYSHNQHATLMGSLHEHWKSAEGLRNILAKLGPDTALIASMEHAAMTAWMAQIGQSLPYIAWLHIIESVYLPEIFKDPAEFDAQSWAFANACRAAQKVVFPTQTCADDLIDHFGVPCDLLSVIPNPQSLARVRRLSWIDDPEAAGLRERHKVIYIHVARLEPQKNHDLLFAAASRLLANRADFAILCVGAGTDDQRVASEIARLGLNEHVFLMGARQNPFPLIARADALVLPSRFESFGLVLVEAMACGVPIVATDCAGGGPRDVLQDGRCGLLLPPDDAEALADGMEQIVTDAHLRERMIAAGFVRAEDFSIRKIAKQWERMIDQKLPA